MVAMFKSKERNVILLVQYVTDINIILYLLTDI